MRNMKGLEKGLVCLFRALAGNFDSKPVTKMFSCCFRHSDQKLLIFSQKNIPFVVLVIFVVLGRPRKLFPLLLALVPHPGTQPNEAAFSPIVH